MEFLQSILGNEAGLTVWTLLKIVAIVVPTLLAVAYLTYAERKVIGYMQVRIGPNRVGPLGLLQPIADAVKLMMKEIIMPAQASREAEQPCAHVFHGGRQHRDLRAGD